VYLRSPRGFLARLADGDPFITGLYEHLGRLLRTAIRAGVLPRQDVRYAVLIWVTIFDERVVVDLVGDLGLSPRQAARRMTRTLLAALAGERGPGLTQPRRGGRARTAARSDAAPAVTCGDPRSPSAIRAANRLPQAANRTQRRGLAGDGFRCGVFAFPVDRRAG